MSDIKRVRCAIYTRKSSEEGLDQSFNSLHAQREACEAYILSQKHEGWEVIVTEYDDGGYSGGNMERPGLKKLMADIAVRYVDAVVVYKVDRLTRSLADFAKIVEQFDGEGVSFVSVTQQFNTTSSMGRLTLNVLLSFAQFEREVTGERIRDKIAASKKRGMWMGGAIPLGYDLCDRLLVPNKEEAERVRTIYRLYLELGCVSKLQQRLDEANIRSKKRLSKTGNASGNVAFSRGALYELLQNPLYLGQVRHKEKIYEGQHEAIIDQPLWDRVQQQLVGNRPATRHRFKQGEASLLTGLLFDEGGNRYTPSHTIKKERRYRYYVLEANIRPQKRAPTELPRIPANEIELLVLKEVDELMNSPQRLSEVLCMTEHADLANLLTAIESRRASRKQPDGVVRECVRKVVICPDDVSVAVSRSAIRAQLGMDRLEYVDDGVIFKTKAAMRLVRAELRFHLPGGAQTDSRPAESLIKALANAHDWLDRILRGEAANQRDLSRQTGYDERYISHVMPLAFLPPNIIESVLHGAQPVDCTLDSLLTSIVLGWDQHTMNLSTS
jgi:site-specific DNA recombinase